MAEKTTGRIISTKNVEKNLITASSVYARHTVDGVASFLNQLEGDNWETMGLTIANARKKHEQAMELKRQMEEAFEQHDALMQPIGAITNSNKWLLKGKYAKPQKAGRMGL